MAEFVEEKIEQGLDEIVLLKNLKLFTTSELRHIISLRRKHEYNVNKSNRKIVDYEGYINSEILFLKLIAIKRAKKKNFEQKSKIERNIITNLAKLHKEACYRFQSDPNVWLRAIYFLEKIDRHSSLKVLWNRFLQVHGRTNPEFWIMAADYRLRIAMSATARSLSNKIFNEKEDLYGLKREAKASIESASDSRSNVIKHEIAMMQDATVGLIQEKRIIWDKAYLVELRECNELLSRGILFNEDHPKLILNLFKLQINLVDFFRNNISVYQKTLLEDVAEEEVEYSADKKAKRRVEEIERSRRYDEAKLMMSFVEENVDAIIRGENIEAILEKTNELMQNDLNENSHKFQTLFKNIKLLIQEFPDYFNNELANKFISSFEDYYKNSNSKQTQPVTEKKLVSSKFSAHLEKAKNLTLNKSLEKLYEFLNEIHEEMLVSDPGNCKELDELIHYRLTALFLPNEESVNQEHLERTMECLKLFFLNSRWKSKSVNLWTIYARIKEKLGHYNELPMIKYEAEKYLEPHLVSRFREQTLMM